MKNVLITIATGLLLVPFAGAQGLDMKFDSLAAKATQKSVVDLEGSTLEMALKMAGPEPAKDGKARQVGEFLKGLLSSLKAVHVRSYKFAKEGDYSDKELEPLLEQVAPGSGWSRIVGAKDHNQSSEIYLLNQGDNIEGCLIVASQPKQVSIVYLMGSMPISQAKEMVNSNIHYDLAALLGGAAK